MKDRPTNKDESGSSDDSTGKEKLQSAKNCPKEKTDTIELEGIKKSFHFTLYESSGLGFSTYITNDLLVEDEQRR
ncbi:hypothetical protein HPK19_24795 (plasmid) [Arthrobacter citreus]|nr:hypothetical protein HPK19_24795 [Arthrobacter citreus]